MEIFLLSILNLISFVRVSVDAQNQFEPFLLHFDKNALSHWNLPEQTIPSIDDEANIRALCPSETEEDKRNSDIISGTYPFVKYCLYTKKFDQDQPKHCTEQPKPWLEDNERICGTSPNHRKYEFGFYHCGGGMGPLQKLRKKKTQQEVVEQFQFYWNRKQSGGSSIPLFFPIYELCFDKSNGKTIWTKHSIMKPAMFEDNEEKLRRETGGDIEISTDPFQFQGNTFTNFQQKYDAQVEQSNKMIKNFLVPKEHVALRVWRNTVNHFINVAPLWDKLEKLMTAINQGIRKIALKFHSDEEEFEIYTGVVDFTDDGKLIRVNNQFPSNIWYKLLHLHRFETAALIVLHNTPHFPPENKICETEMPCDLKKWYEKKDDDDEDISDEVFEYAYCCNPSTSEVEKLLKFTVRIEASLILDEFFKTSKAHEEIPEEEETVQNNTETPQQNLTNIKTEKNQT